MGSFLRQVLFGSVYSQYIGMEKRMKEEEMVGAKSG